MTGFAPAKFLRPGVDTYFDFSRQSYYNKKPPEGGLLLITSDGDTCKPYALFCLDGNYIVSQVEQNCRVCATEVRVAKHSFYFCLGRGWKMESAASDAANQTSELIDDGASKATWG